MTEENNLPSVEPFKPIHDEVEGIGWETENGEKRSVCVFEGEAGDVLVVFKRDDKSTALRLSDHAATALASLLLKRKTTC